MLTSFGLRGSSASDPKTSEGFVARYLLLAVTLPSTGPRESSSSDPKTSEGGNLLCSLPLASMFLLPCLHAPSATGPKVVSPTPISPRDIKTHQFPILARPDCIRKAETSAAYPQLSTRIKTVYQKSWINIRK